MSLPDTFAGGQFGLPLQVAKLVRLAESTTSTPERETAIRKLWKRGYFLDRANVIWDRTNVPSFAVDPLYSALVKEAA